MEKYDITDYLKDDKELQKAVIDEFLKEIADLRAENERLKEEVRTEKIYSSQVEELEESLSHLKQENDKLKEEVETRDNLVEHFRKEAINWAKTSNDCIKDIENYKQTLQEIKEIAEQSNVDCIYRISVIRKILTKAEEEWK